MCVLPATNYQYNHCKKKINIFERHIVTLTYEKSAHMEGISMNHLLQNHLNIRGTYQNVSVPIMKQKKKKRKKKEKKKPKPKKVLEYILSLVTREGRAIMDTTG
jgi:hypothetical protein